MKLIEALLLYQNTDRKLIKIEQAIAGSNERRNYAKTRNFMMKAPEKLEALESRSVQLKAAMANLSDRLAQANRELDELDALSANPADSGAALYYKRKVQEVLDRLYTVKKEVATLERIIRDTKREYDELKQKTIRMQKDYKETREAYEALVESKKAEKEAITAELNEVAKGIPPELCKKFNQKRKEGIFPVVVEIKNNNMCICGADFTSAEIERLSGEAPTECERCGRIIYKR